MRRFCASSNFIVGFPLIKNLRRLYSIVPRNMEKGDCCDIVAKKKVGDSCNIVKILSTAERDFLLRNNRDQVKIESLKGKTICIYFMSLLEKCKCRSAESSKILAEVYNELSPKGEFEVVFVATTQDGDDGSPKKEKLKFEDEEVFKRTFSEMPWLSIPFSDEETRNHLCKMFSMPPFWGSECVIVSPKGKVLLTNVNMILENYGAEGYPFTNERIEKINEEDEAIRANLCLKTLLDSPPCDFVITNKFDKVPISELEGKVVGLYFYDGEREIKENLLEVYNELKGSKDLEIVLINLHFLRGYIDNESFKENFEKMPWLALPFMDKRIRKVWRVFNHPCVSYSDEGILVIIGPDGEFVETFSSGIIEKYGIEAYPFTQEKAVEIEMKRRKQVTLESLFGAAKQKSVINSDGTEISLSDLEGKNILLFFADKLDKECIQVVTKLKEWYKEIKEKDETFEVILVSEEDSQENFDKLYKEMQWLAFSSDAKVQPMFEGMDICSPQLVAFGSDGHLVTDDALTRLATRGAGAYPFTDELAEEIYEFLSLG